MYEIPRSYTQFQLESINTFDPKQSRSQVITKRRNKENKTNTGELRYGCQFYSDHSSDHTSVSKSLSD